MEKSKQEQKDLEKIDIKFTKSKDHKTFTATGAWGGINPQGEIVCHLYVEHQALPEKIKLGIDKSGGQVVETVTNSNTFLREVQHTLVLRPSIAQSIGDWLVKHAKKGSVATLSLKKED